MRRAGLAYFAVTGFRPGLSGKIKIHDNLLLLLHLLLFLYRIVPNTVHPAVVVTRVELLIVKLSSWGSEVLSVHDLYMTNRSTHTQP